MERLRVGVIGCGGVAQVMHLPYLRELDGRCEIAAPYDLCAEVSHPTNEPIMFLSIYSGRRPAPRDLALLDAAAS